MMIQEPEPVLRFGFTARFQPLQVAGHGGLGDRKPQSEQFAVNAGSTPRRIVRLHSPLCDANPQPALDNAHGMNE